MSGRGATLSPESVGAGSEWSGISGYQSRPAPDPPYSPTTAYNRGALATPPVSTGSAGVMNGGLPNGTARAPNSPGNPSPPSSIGRSSTGTGLYASSDGGQSRKAYAQEETLAEHYVALKRFLAPTLRDEKGNPRPNRARDKLLRLSPVQFHELSTDVFDELVRRQASAGQRRPPPGGSPIEPPPPYLLPKTSFHPKRNQARQKLSTLPPPRFRDLATDVFYELERRFPRFVGGDIDRLGSPASFRGGYGRNGSSSNGPMGPGGPRPGSRGQLPRGSGPPPRNGLQPYGGPGSRAPSNEYGRPLPKTFQSNTIIPNKSTMVEDDDEQTPEDDEFDPYSLGPDSRRPSARDTGRSSGSTERDKKLIAEFQAEAESLQEKVADLENQSQDKDQEIAKLQGSERDRSALDSERQEWSELRSDLEAKLSEAQDLQNSMQSALKKSQAQNVELERELNLQARRDPSDSGDEWKDRYQNLAATHEELQAELREQQEVTEEVRREASEFLREMKLLSDRSDQSWEREEKLVKQIAQAEDEVKEWKSRYARMKTQLRNMRTSSTGPSIESQNAAQFAKEGGFTSQDGMVKDVHVTRFQIAIDELLQLARRGEPSAVLKHMKTVVMSIRHITQDIGEASTGDADEDRRRSKSKARVSSTANNLITASKNFSTSNGISPVSLVDAAASHLSSAIVELLHAVKIRPTPPGELDDQDEDTVPPSGGSPGFFPVRNGSIDGESVYSTLSSPPGEVSAQPRGQSNGPLQGGWGSKRQPSPRGAQNMKPAQTSAASFGLGLRMQDEDIEDLKIFLEDQTERLVGSIQNLVGGIRAEDHMSTTRQHIGDIASVVAKVVSSTEATMNRTGNVTLRDRGEPIVDRLADCRARILSASAESEHIRDLASLKDFSNRLPPLAFEIARETKELVQRIDSLEHHVTGSSATSFH